MTIQDLEQLKKKIELCKQTKAQLEGQRKELNTQKDALKKRFDEEGVTIDTLPLAIDRLNKELASVSEDITNVLDEAEKL